MPSSQRIPNKRMPLTELPVGKAARVWALDGEPNLCSRLREIGFCESAVVEKVSGRETLLCQLCGTRIALSAGAAVHIVVELAPTGS
jgi:ferrous iron transport protein A